MEDSPGAASFAHRYNLVAFMGLLHELPYTHPRQHARRSAHLGPTSHTQPRSIPSSACASRLWARSYLWPVCPLSDHVHAASERRPRPRPHCLSPPQTKSRRHPDTVPVSSTSHPDSFALGRPFVGKGELAVWRGEGRAAGLRMKRDNGVRLRHTLVESAPPVAPCRLRRVLSVFTHRIANLDKPCCPVLLHSNLKELQD